MTVTAQWELKSDIEYDFEVTVGETFEIEVYSTSPQAHTIICSADVPFTCVHASTGTAFGDRVYWTNGYEITVNEVGSYIFYVKGSNTLTYKVKVSAEVDTDTNSTEPSTGGNVISPTEPLPTPGGTTYENGDVNMDGNLNIKDATAIQKHIASIITFSQESIKYADYNCDGNINIKDATAIQKKIAGLI